LEHRKKLMVDALFEKPLSRRKRTTFLCFSWFIPTIWNTPIFLVVSSTFFSGICCLSSFHWLWRFHSLSDIWCSNRESWLTIPWLDDHELMRYSILWKEKFWHRHSKNINGFLSEKSTNLDLIPFSAKLMSSYSKST
jgi:hypothetical protein